MTNLQGVDVKELKNRLSSYLRDVREGEVVLVTDRGRVIAELRQPSSGTPLTGPDRALERLDSWRGGRPRATHGHLPLRATVYTTRAQLARALGDEAGRERELRDLQHGEPAPRRQGFGIVRLDEVNLAHATDEAIVAYARDHRYVVVA